MRPRALRRAQRRRPRAIRLRRSGGRESRRWRAPSHWRRMVTGSLREKRQAPVFDEIGDRRRRVQQQAQCGRANLGAHFFVQVVGRRLAVDARNQQCRHQQQQALVDRLGRRDLVRGDQPPDRFVEPARDSASGAPISGTDVRTETPRRMPGSAQQAHSASSSTGGREMWIRTFFGLTSPWISAVRYVVRWSTASRNRCADLGIGVHRGDEERLEAQRRQQIHVVERLREFRLLPRCARCIAASSSPISVPTAGRTSPCISCTFQFVQRAASNQLSIAIPALRVVGDDRRHLARRDGGGKPQPAHFLCVASHRCKPLLAPRSAAATRASGNTSCRRRRCATVRTTRRRPSG